MKGFKEYNESNDKIEQVKSELKTMANEWSVFCAEDGEDKCKRQFKALVTKARELGINNVVDKYPDGTKI
jgi:hypothetical protein